MARHKRMRPYSGLPDPSEMDEDGKPGGDDELGSSGPPDPAPSKKGGQSGRGGRAASNAEQIRAQERGQIKHRSKKFREEMPANRRG